MNLLGQFASAQVQDKDIIHFFGNGDLCDLTGKPREASVVFRCDPSALPAQLNSLREERACR